MFGSEWGGKGIVDGHLFDTERPTFLFAREIASLRRQEAALKYGRQYFLNTAIDLGSLGRQAPHHYVFAFTRVLDTAELLIVVNTSTETQECIIEHDQHEWKIDQPTNLIRGGITSVLRRIPDQRKVAAVKIEARSICLFRTSP